MKISQTNEQIEMLEKKKYGKDTFISTVRRFMEMKHLTRQLLLELIDKIVVHETQGVGKKRTQRVEIYWRFVGYVELPEAVPQRNFRKDTRKGVSIEYILNSHKINLYNQAKGDLKE